jgi:hypothetical protein
VPPAGGYGRMKIDVEPPTPDCLGKLGAEQLARRIQKYWVGLGHTVRV